MKKIVVIGGGYAGVSFIRYFSKLDIDAEVYLIDQNPYQYLQPEVYSFIANESIISDIIIDLSTLCRGLGKNVYFFKEKVEYIDPERNEIYGDRFRLKYDYLVVSAGSRTFFPPIEGLREHASGVKTLERSLEFKQKFERKILQKIKEEEKCYIVKESQFNIIVGGAGLAGVEIAAEMAYYAREFFKKIGFLCEGLNITLIEAADRILPGMDEFVYETAYNRLKSLGVNILTGKKIIKVDCENVYLEDGDYIKQDFFIWTGGIVASSLIGRMKIKTNRRKQAVVDQFFRPEGIDNIFIIGDCAEIKNYETGEIFPPMAQIAIQTGEITARYIRDLIKGKKPQVESPIFRGMVSALGGKYGVGMIKNGIKFRGFPAYLFKELVFLHYKLPLRHISKKGYRRLLEH
ncbi:NAD(P)/FAD-dependent oxidoreductase [Persephonella atlantica]|uniref:NAD(P)/FAD-dependent oxidoreductase n=1 Tax=Persephonella atlantica TaxID=2699429 RepID=A0ABS1GIN0_9AQUI|nr:NAD(P)/FAD-dependent oxidoreductase [Persephonella atlantica]MBK3332755.1 NAD(P)/FAD-dependent oxidoreductase [Persephonella atlantica]